MIIHRFVATLLIVFLFACKKEDDKQNTGPLPEQSVNNLAYGNDAAQKMDLYLPAGRSTDSTPLLVLIHGGAWSAGDKADFGPELPVLKQKLPKFAIANINYRLATTSSNFFPTQEADMKAALAFLTQKQNEYKFGRHIALLGVSSGGHMALLQAYKNNTPAISAVINFFGPADMVSLYNSTTEPNLRLGLTFLLGGTPATNAPLYQSSSPINFVTAQSPPTLILHGQNDAIVPVQQAQLLSDKLTTAGVAHQRHIYQGVGHDVWPQPILQGAYGKVELFLKTYVR